MPYLETPTELADKIASLAHVNGDRRPPFIETMVTRIRDSVANEKLLERGQPSLLAKPQRIQLGTEPAAMFVDAEPIRLWPYVVVFAVGAISGFSLGGLL